MRGDEQLQSGLVLMSTLEDVVPDDHPLRAIRTLVDGALLEMSPTLDALYASRGRPSIAPEYLLRAQLVQILYAISSERRLCEELRYNLLLRWFVGLPMDEPVFHPTSFTKNRDRLLTHEVAEAFFEAIRAHAEAHRLLSREHFSLDGSLLEAAASLKSLRPIEKGRDDDTPSGGRNPSVDFHGKRRANASHRSTTDPDARLARKGQGKEAKLCYAGHLLSENRHGLIVACELTKASGTADFVEKTRALRITPHMAAKGRYSALDARTTSWAGYAISQRRRKLIEEAYGWMKVIGGLGKLRHRGTAKVAAIFTFTAAAYNLVRLRSLLAEPSPA